MATAWSATRRSPQSCWISTSANRLEAADGEKRCAEVETDGVLGQELQFTTVISISGPPDLDPPETSIEAGANEAREPGGLSAGYPAMFAVLAVALGLLARSVRASSPRQTDPEVEDSIRP